MTPHKGLKCSCERSVRPIIWALEGNEKAVTVATTGQGQDLHLGLGLREEPESLGSDGSPWGVGPPPNPQVSETLLASLHSFPSWAGGRVACKAAGSKTISPRDTQSSDKASSWGVGWTEPGESGCSLGNLMKQLPW